MKILEQILQEIDKESVYIDNYYVHRNGQDDNEMYISLTKAKEIIRSHMKDGPVSNTYKLDDGWICASERKPEHDMRVQALIKHHKWIADFESSWVPEEEKTVHPERLEICEAIYKNGKFTFRDLEDDEFAVTAHILPRENIAEPICEILIWRPVACTPDNWIPVEYPPKTDEYILLSFSNFALPMIGRYEADEKGGVFYLGDCDEEDTCISNDLFVNAWQPLPKQYHPEN